MNDVTPGPRPTITAADVPLVNDHPDLAGLLRDPRALAAIGPALVAPWKDSDIDVVMSPEARGPIVGALAAQALGVGLVILRKEGENHPGADLRITTEPTWRGQPQTFQARTFDLRPGMRVLAVDDWVTTGNSLRAVRQATEAHHGEYVGSSAVVDKTDAATRTELRTHTLVDFDAILAAGRSASDPRTT